MRTTLATIAALLVFPATVQAEDSQQPPRVSHEWTAAKHGLRYQYRLRDATPRAEAKLKLRVEGPVFPNSRALGLRITLKF